MADSKKYPVKDVESIWVATTPKTSYPSLEDEIETDVAVVGCGITGISTALILHKKGMKVALIDNAQIVLGTTGYTTAKVTSQHGLIYGKIKDKHSLEAAKVYAEANEWAISEINRIASVNNINCDLLEKPAYTYNTTQEGLEQIKKELEICQSIGLKASVVEEDLGLPFKTLGAIKYDSQYQFHPRKYLLPLAEKLSKEGVRIFANSAMISLEEGAPNVVKTEKGQIKAKFVVLATKTPVIGKEAWQQKQEKKMSFVVCGPLKRNFPDGVFYPLDKSLYSLRTQPTDKGKYLLYGGQDIWTEDNVGQEEMDKVLGQMSNKAKEIFDMDVEYYWMASDHISKDYLPYIGRIRPDADVFMATGFSGWGMTTGVYAAKIIADEILGKDNPWTKTFLPYR